MKAFNLVTPAHCGSDIDWQKVLNSKNLIIYFFPEIPFDNVNIVSQDAYRFKNYFVRLDLSQNTVLGVTDDPRDLNPLFVQRFGIPFHIIYDRQHDIAGQFEKVLDDKGQIQRTLVCIRKGGQVAGVYQGDEIDGNLKRMVQFTNLPWYRKFFKKLF